jgi:hypothetical protein
MANPEHLQILQQGVKAWNQWQDQHRNIWPDISGANLSGATLSRANLSRTNLSRTNLSKANLSGANLSGANLSGADLDEADLSEAFLGGATLIRADLREATLIRATLIRASLSGAYLRGTDLGGAYLCGTDLREAYLSNANLTKTDLFVAEFGETVFGNTNLTAAQGLETCRHFRPSTLDHRTLARSGPLPLAFLRGCGLPDELIEYLPSLLGEPIQYDSLFISYASRDQVFAERLYADLQNKGVRCWYAPEDMKIGDEYRSRIDASIHLQDRLLLILSEHSIKSRWVQKEVETAFEKEEKDNRLVLFPIRLDDVVMQIDVGWAADIRRQRHIGDFTQWKEHDVYQKAFDRLLRDLQAVDRQPEG